MTTRLFKIQMPKKRENEKQNVSSSVTLPIRCPNGDCWKSLDDCPSLLQCPNSFSILCNDGSCRMLSDNCVKASEETQCIDKTITRCPDETCTKTKFLFKPLHLVFLDILIVGR